MLRGWRREKAQIARRRLSIVVIIVASQTFFDAIIPQVSMAGIFPGRCWGFALGLALNDRLTALPVRVGWMSFGACRQTSANAMIHPLHEL